MQEQRQEEEEKLIIASRNLDEMTRQYNRLKTDSKAVKDALKAKLTTGHAELSKVAMQVEEKRQELQAAEQELTEFHNEQEEARILGDEQLKQQQLGLRKLEEKMEKIQNDMLIDEQAIVEQRKEYAELKEQIEKDEEAWQASQRQRHADEDQRYKAHRAEHQRQLEEQTKKAKEELMALSSFMTSQSDAIKTQYTKKLNDMDRMQDNLEALVEKYQLDRQQLDKDIEEYATKKQHLDQLVKRLEASEAQYKDRQEALDWEVARLESQH
jgi:chromosome segregation ATPase